MRSLLAGLLLFFAVAVKAQTTGIPYVVPTVAAMKTYFGNGNIMYVSATNQFYTICTSCSADESTVFAGASGRKWKVMASGGGSDARKRDTTSVLGVIYNKNSWVTGDLSGFNIAAPTPTIVGTKLSFTSTSSTYNSGEYVAIDSFNHCFENWHLAYREIPQTTSGATTNGSGIGSASTAMNYQQFLTAWVGLSTNTTFGQGRLNISNGTTIYASSAANAITWSVGDKIVTTFDRAGNTVIAKAWNETTNSIPVTVTYQFSTVYLNAAQNLPNTGKFSISPMGGNVQVDSIAFTVNEIVGADLLVLQDSKGVAYGSTYSNSPSNLARNDGYTVVNLSGGGNRNQDMYVLKDDIKKLRPKQVMTEISTNDGLDSVSAKYYYNKTIDSLHSFGMSVLIQRPYYDNPVYQTWRLNYVDRTYARDSIIDTYTPTKQKGAVLIDSLHLTDLGDSLVYDAWKGSGKLKGGGGARFNTGLGKLYPNGLQDAFFGYWGNSTFYNKVTGVPYIKLGLTGVVTAYRDGLNVSRGMEIDGAFDDVAMLTSSHTGLHVTPTATVNQKATFQTPKIDFTTGSASITGGAGFLQIAAVTGATNKATISTNNFLFGINSVQDVLAAFQLTSTTQGFLITPMTKTNRTAISNPSTGLMVYQSPAVGTDAGGLFAVKKFAKWGKIWSDGVDTLGYSAGTNVVNFDLENFQTLSITGNTTFGTSNLVAGREVIVRIISDASSRTLTFPGTWKFMTNAAPSSIAASKTAILILRSLGTTDADVVASYVVEP
jgi:hypothetical protein